MKQKALIITDNQQVSTAVIGDDIFLEVVPKLTSESINNVLLDYAFGNIHPIMIVSDSIDAKDIASSFSLPCLSSEEYRAPQY